jgi:hypothetical protein
MARFYFHTNHPAELSMQDDQGVEFSSVHAAKCAAVKYAGQLLADVGEHFWDTADFELMVTDETALSCSACVSLGPKLPPSAPQVASRISSLCG